MPIRMIQFHGSNAGRPNWLAPIVFILAIIGGVFVLLTAALVGTLVLAAGALARLFLPSPGSPPEASRKSFRQTVATHLLNRIFHRAPKKAGWETEDNWSPSDSQERPAKDERTISMDRGEDGIWRP